MCKPRFKQADIVRQIFGKLLQLGNQPCAAPEAEQAIETVLLAAIDKVK